MQNTTNQPVDNSLCSLFIDQSIKTWNWLQSSTITGIKISEESITHSNLLDFTAKNPQDIITKQTNRRKQSNKIGSDWELWLTSGDNWLGFRLQTKKLNPRTLTYPTLDKKNEYGTQNDLLEYHAFTHDPPLIPIYLFYNYWNVNKFNPSWKCCSFPRCIEMLGCTLSLAQDVKNILREQSKSLLDIDNIMIPWSCLVCCTKYSKKGDDLPNRAFNFINTGLVFSPKIAKQEFITQDAPWYIQKIVDKGKLTRKEWGLMDIKRITIIHSSILQE